MTLRRSDPTVEADALLARVVARGGNPRFLRDGRLTLGGKVTMAESTWARRNRAAVAEALKRLTLQREWTREAAEARAGADWFAEWPEGGRVRWAASMAWIAREDQLDVPADLGAWVEARAENYEGELRER